MKGKLNALDGAKTLNLVEEFEYNHSENFGEKFAKIILEKGGKEMMEVIKSKLKN